MRCAKAQRWIQRALDDDLTSRHDRALRRHLVSCSECERLWSEFHALHEATRNLARLGPTGVWNRPLAITGRRRFSWLLPAAIAASVFIGFAAWRFLPRPDAPPVIAGSDRPPNISSEVPPPAGLAASPRVRVEFSPESDVIAIERPASRPNITILWVYPALRTADASPDRDSTSTSSLKGAES